MKMKKIGIIVALVALLGGGYIVFTRYTRQSSPAESPYPCGAYKFRDIECFGVIDKKSVDFFGTGQKTEVTLYSTTTDSELGRIYVLSFSGLQDFRAPVTMPADMGMDVVDSNRDGKEELLATYVEDGTGVFTSWNFYAAVDGKIKEFWYSDLKLPSVQASGTTYAFNDDGYLGYDSNSGKLYYAGAVKYDDRGKRKQWMYRGITFDGRNLLPNDEIRICPESGWSPAEKCQAI